VVNANFGCGSSREHAPQALRRRGFGALVGESFGEIFLGNSTAIGLPCVTASREDIAEIMARATDAPALAFTLDIERQQLSAGDGNYAVSLPATIRHALITGEWDATGLLLDNYGEVERVEAKLPYRFADKTSAT